MNEVPSCNREVSDDAKGKTNAEAIRAFMRMTEAYRIMTDPKRKQVYELSGSAGLKSMEQGPRFEDPLRDAYK
jgi:DnaJ-class molecular chaperone